MSYEEASDRFDRISRQMPVIREAAKVMLELAEAEYEAARTELAKYEVSPGIPKAEYR